MQIYGIATFGLKVSDAYVMKLNSLLASLADFPSMAPEIPGLDRPVRILPYRVHVVVYRVEDDTVRILRIRHARENWTAGPLGDDAP